MTPPPKRGRVALPPFDRPAVAPGCVDVLQCGELKNDLPRQPQTASSWGLSPSSLVIGLNSRVSIQLHPESREPQNAEPRTTSIHTLLRHSVDVVWCGTKLAFMLASLHPQRIMKSLMICFGEASDPATEQQRRWIAAQAEAFSSLRCHLLPGLWLIKTPNTTAEVRDELLATLGPSVPFFVLDVTGGTMHWAGVSAQVHQWLMTQGL
jgi:hypothetical protein